MKKQTVKQKPRLPQGHQKIVSKTKKIYLRKIGKISSPALNGEYVAFNSKGFNHLVRKGRNPRPRSEQQKRFLLIPYAESIIKSSKATIIYRTNETKYWVNRHGQKVLITSIAQFWTFSEKVDKRTIKVVVRQLNQGEKHFFSIMEKEERNPRNKKSR